MHNKMRELRKKAGLTQEELASKANISRPFLSAIENGSAIPTVTKAMAIAKNLDTTVDELFNTDSGEEKN
ncbi:MAG: helix-turn-helix transcriptional regulator [Oscillospiraceae bacterium]|nr:helix-turn-helix transcriptional regulator [Oscillospiraceae bacterium]